MTPAPSPLATPLNAGNSPLDPRALAIVADLNARASSRKGERLPDGLLNAERRRRTAITRDEIAGQPDCIRTTLAAEKDAVEAIAGTLRKAPIRRLYLTGCGDSLAVMIAARVLLEEMFEVPCEPVQALDMAYYFNRPVDRETLVVGLSSSGESVRTVEAMLVARAKGARTLALSNTPGSTVMREAELTLTIHAERKGWPTQASTAALALLLSLALARGRPDKPAARIDQLSVALGDIPDQVATTIAIHEPAIAALAGAVADRSMFLFSGGGPSFACAFFGAAKVKECSADHAMAIPLEEYHHYPSVRPGDPLFLIAPNGLSIPRARDTAEAAMRAGARVCVVAAADNASFDGHATEIIRLPPMIERLSPLVYTVPSQLFAYHLAVRKATLAEASVKPVEGT